MNRLLTFPKENVEKRGDHSLSGEGVLSNHLAHGENQGKISKPLSISKMNRIVALVKEKAAMRGDYGLFGEGVLSNHLAHGENQGKISQPLFISRVNHLLALAKENVEKRGDRSLSGEKVLRNHPAHGENPRENQEKTLAGGTSSNPDSMKENYFHNKGKRVLSNHPAHGENPRDQGEINHLANQIYMIHSHNRTDIIKYDPGHGNAAEKTLAGGTSSNPNSMKENYFHNKGKRVLSNHPAHAENQRENQGEINQSFFISKMNRPLALAKENVEKRGDHGLSGERVLSNHLADGKNQREINHLTNQTDMIHFHNRTDIIKCDPGHGNVAEKTLARGTSSNPDSMKENYFHNDGQEVTSLVMSPNHSAPRNNNVSLAPLVQPARTMSSVAQEDIPFYYLVPPDNLISHAWRACTAANPQLGTGNSESFTVTFSTPSKDQIPSIPPPPDTNPSYPSFVTDVSFAGYHLNETAPINGSSPIYGADINRFNGLNKSNAVDLSPSTPIDHAGSFGASIPNISNNNIRDKANKQKAGEVEENSTLLRPLKRRNINIFPPAHGERELLPNTDLLLFPKDVNVGDIGAIPSQNEAIPSQNEARCVPSTSDGTNYGQDKDENDLDLSLHL